MSKILIIGDIMGRPGRRALAQVLPMWKEELDLDLQTDVIIGNVENLAHGRGITPATIEEMDALGFDAYTSGNHVFGTGPQAQACFDSHDNIIRPYNYGTGYMGPGYYRFAKNGQQYLLLNLAGTVFMDAKNEFNASNPFFAFDQLFQEQAQKDDIIILDLHAEATSEKVAMGWHVDGRATIMYGTHTHVPTADERLFPKGLAHITDVGMTGAQDSVIGITPEVALLPYLEQGKMHQEFPESGPAVANAILIETEGNKPQSIKRLQKIVHVK